jgi:HlyD family secretion protein
LQAGFRSEEINQAKAEVAAARARTDLAKNNLQDSQLRAPAKGIIFTRVQEPGSIIAFGEPVYTLSITEPIWVRGYVSEVDLGRVKPGMQVFVYIDTYNNPFKGQIGFISPQAEFTPKNIETKEIRTDLVYRLRIAVIDPENHLRQGMPVSIHIPIYPEQPTEQMKSSEKKQSDKLPAREEQR